MNSRNVTRRQFLQGVGGLSIGGLLLAACAPSQSGSAASQDGEATGVQSDVATIVHWDFGGGEFEYIDAALTPEFKELHPEIEIEHVGIPEDGFTTKVKSAVSAGAQPDVAACFDNTWWKAGLCIALDDMLEAHGINWREDYFQPVVQVACIIDDDKLYGMPVLAHCNAALINLDLFEQAGLEPWDITVAYDHSKWYEMAAAINVPSDDISSRIWGSVMFNPKFASVKHGQATPYWAGNDGRQALGNIDSPEWIQMFKYMYQAWQEELVPIGEVAQGLGTDPFLLNQQGFKDLGAYGSYVDAIEQGINARVVQKPCIGPDKGITGLGGWTTPWTIFKATSVPQAAQDWVYYLGTDGAIAFTKYEGNSEPPALKKLAEDHSLWARSEEDAQTVLHIVDNAPPLVFTPNFRPIYEPMVVAWTRITEEGVDVETAIHEAAVEVQELLDDAWEQWDALAA